MSRNFLDPFVIPIICDFSRQINAMRIFQTFRKGEFFASAKRRRQGGTGVTPRARPGHPPSAVTRRHGEDVPLAILLDRFDAPSDTVAFDVEHLNASGLLRQGASVVEDQSHEGEVIGDQVPAVCHAPSLHNCPGSTRGKSKNFVLDTRPPVAILDAWTRRAG